LTLEKNSGELVSKIIEKSAENDKEFTSLTWALTILEGNVAKAGSGNQIYMWTAESTINGIYIYFKMICI